MGINYSEIEKRESNLKAMTEAYDRNSEREWFRLVKEPYNNIEFLTTMHFIRKYFPKKGLVLDAGGGPGRYAIELCKSGYDVVLFDISSGNIDNAKEKLKFEKEIVQNRMSEFCVGDVRNLSRFEDSYFDAVLCLDPLSNLFEEEDRKKVVMELNRIAKPEAPVFIGGRGFLAVLKTILIECTDELLSPALDELIKIGNIKAGPNVCHFFRANELKNLTESCGFETINMVGCIGLSMGLREELNELSKNNLKWEKWFKIEMETASDPSVVDLSEHLLYIGKKPEKLPF